MADFLFAPPPSSSRTPSAPSFSVLEQLQTRTLLLRLLPPELVYPILHYPAYYTISISSREERKSVASPNRIHYLSSPAFLLHGRVERVKVHVRGMDQGFMVCVDDQDAMGMNEAQTEKRTHSFFEVYLLRSRTEGGEEEVEVKGSRRVLCSNKLAFPRLLTHVVALTRDGEGADLFGMIRPGDKFALDVVADQSWWVNIVESARFEISTSYFDMSAPEIEESR